MSTWAELLGRLKEDALYDLDLPGADADDDRAYRELLKQGELVCRRAELYARDVALTLTAGTGVYPLGSAAFSRRVDRPIRLHADGATWGAVLAGEPAKGAYMFRRAYHSPTPDGVGALVFSGAPSSAEAARTWTLEAFVLPSVPNGDGSNDAAMPVELEDAAADLALVELAKRYATEGSQITRLASMKGDAHAAIAEFRARSRRDRYRIGTPRSGWVAR